MNYLIGVLVGIYLVVGVVTYVLVVNLPGTGGQNKLQSALAAAIWPLSLVWSFLDDRGR